MKRYAIICLTILLAAALAGCAAQKTEAPELLIPVGAQMDTATVARGALTDLMVYEAAVAPRYAELYFTHDTRIGAIPVMVGQQVKAGDVLINMDVSSVEGAIASLDAEKAAIADAAAYEKQLYDIDMEIYSLEMSRLTDEVAQYDLQTVMDLYDLEFQNAEAARAERLTAIEGERAAYEAQLAGTYLASPCDGRVAYIGCAPGQQVGAYDTVCVVTDDSQLVLQSETIPESVLKDALELYAQIGGEKRAITLEPVDEDEYARTILKGGTYLNTFLPDSTEGLEAGQSAAVFIVTDQQKDALKVPVNALFSEDEEYYVYVVEDGARTRRDVQVGLVTSMEAEITSGLEEGEIVYVGD